MINLFYYQVAAPVLIECFDQISPYGVETHAKMTPMDYSVMSQDIGEMLFKMLKWTISRKEYKLLNDEGKEKVIRSLSSQIRTAGKSLWKDEYPEDK